MSLTSQSAQGATLRKLRVSTRVCVMPAGNPETKRRLELAGVRVHEFFGSEVLLKGEWTDLAHAVNRSLDALTS